MDISKIDIELSKESDLYSKQFDSEYQEKSADDYYQGAKKYHDLWIKSQNTAPAPVNEELRAALEIAHKRLNKYIYDSKIDQIINAALANTQQPEPVKAGEQEWNKISEIKPENGQMIIACYGDYRMFFHSYAPNEMTSYLFWLPAPESPQSLANASNKENKMK